MLTVTNLLETHLIIPGGLVTGKSLILRPKGTPKGTVQVEASTGPLRDAERNGHVTIHDSGGAREPEDVSDLPSVMRRKRMARAQECRTQIDPNRLVIGNSPVILRVFEDIGHANSLDELAAVLLLGETGVGKTHVAKLIHDSSRRSREAYRGVSAGASGGDPTIQRGEWVGYGKGHGIRDIDPKGKSGYILEADGGTLFVDELTSLSAEVQSYFLPVLERKAVQKVGGETARPDVRCIFATNAELARAGQNRILRRDLLARIPTRIAIPSLRERRGDILVLACHFAGEESRFGEPAKLALLLHDWPENVRQLKAEVASAVARGKAHGHSLLDLDDLNLPSALHNEVASLSTEDCRRRLWELADQIAREEGMEKGAGLQRRAAESLGVKESQASKMYRTLGL